ncbi:hypothetical protein KO481_06365 [Nocardia sp. NEAU-G5]|uniref:Uncharacterized protein n=1 Tax=Nocardia albiluteola TaxID=2842303 RepID=A0ABS6ASY3_9NOCA|nr:hypothetical protein [Nocardia albiluteola]MBU3061145.1 hypothetical protein [Nocardia albiluteola]
MTKPTPWRASGATSRPAPAAAQTSGAISRPVTSRPQTSGATSRPVVTATQTIAAGEAVGTATQVLVEPPPAATAQEFAVATENPGTATSESVAALPPAAATPPSPSPTSFAGMPPNSARFARTWPYALAAVGCIVYFCLMFKPWLTAANWSGSVTCDAFGTIATSTSHLSLWSPYNAPGAHVNGIYALLASVLVFVAVLAAMETIRSGNPMAATIVAGAALGVTALALIDMFYLYTKIGEVQATVSSDKDLGMQLGLVVSTLRGTGSYPWPGKKVTLDTANLTDWAFISPAVVFGSSVIALVRSLDAGRRTITTAVRFVAKQVF